MQKAIQNEEINQQKLKQVCNKAIDNILRDSITDVEIFKRPFELEYLKRKENRNEVVNIVTTSIIAAVDKNDFSQLKLKKVGHVLFPKKNLSDYRRCALVDIYDEIVYLTLVLYIAKAVENNRIPKKDNIVHSYRVRNYENNPGILFDIKWNYTSFRKQYINLKSDPQNNVMVSCDISNFYDRINIHRIESALLSMDGINKGIVSLINQILLFWANRDSYGLPVGSNASRILAEAVLADVDNYLLSRGINFCRFVDDYRIFATDAYRAHSALALLSECLSREGLFLNVTKTSIEDISKVKPIGEKDDLCNQDFNDIQDEAIDREEQQKQKDLIRGYSGLVPTRFRRPSKTFELNHKEYSISEKYEALLQTPVIDPKDIREIISTIYIQRQYEYYSKMPELLKKYPQFIPYFVSVLSKTDAIPESTIDTISEELIKWFDDDALPEYIQVYIIRMLGSKPFNKTKSLLKIFRNLKRNSGDYVGRALLEELQPNLDRSNVLEIREYYDRADIWEKRAILQIVKRYLPQSESSPFYKNIEFHNDDVFTKLIIKNEKKQKKTVKKSQKN